MSDPTPNSRQTYIVMLVDDQAIMAEAVRRIFATQPDIEFHYCAEGLKAVARAAEIRPMVILQDLVMPATDGMELLKQYRAHPALRDTPVIVLSTKEDPLVKKQAFECGAYDYLVKLPAPIELIARVRHHAQSCLAARQLAEALRALSESQRQLLERNVQLEALNEQKNRILGVAAHDLRNPLGLINTLSDFLDVEARDTLCAEHRTMVRHIQDLSEFTLRMVENLLNVSTIEAGALRMDIAPTDLTELIARNIELNALLAAKKRIALEFTPGEPLPLLPLDAGKLNQVLNNLIANAVKYSHPDTSVRITLGRQADHVLIEVTDQGLGIPAEEHSKLFKPFGRTSVVGTAGEQSTGLGLVIVRKIIEGHGGRIGVRSAVGQGSTFWFTLPLPTETTK